MSFATHVFTIVESCYILLAGRKRETRRAKKGFRELSALVSNSTNLGFYELASKRTRSACKKVNNFSFHVSASATQFLFKVFFVVSVSFWAWLEWTARSLHIFNVVLHTWRAIDGNANENHSPETEIAKLFKARNIYWCAQSSRASSPPFVMFRLWCNVRVYIFLSLESARLKKRAKRKKIIKNFYFSRW